MRRHAHRLLAGSGVGHQQYFLGLEEIPQRFDFFDKHLVDLLPTGSVEDLDVAILLARPIEAEGRHPADILFVRWRSENRHSNLPG
jgi:hypothetical protein